MAIKQELVGVSADTLTRIISTAEEAIIAILTRGGSYTIAGRSFTFSTLGELKSLVAEANYALGLLNGTRSEVVRANFNSSTGRGSR